MSNAILRLSRLLLAQRDFLVQLVIDSERRLHIRERIDHPAPIGQQQLLLAGARFIGHRPRGVPASKIVCAMERPRLAANKGLVAMPVSVPLEAPADPVSEIDGNSAARAAARFRVRAFERGFGARHIGPARQQLGWKPWFHARRLDRAEIARGYIEAFRRTPEQNGQCRACLQFLLFELRDLRPLPPQSSGVAVRARAAMPRRSARRASVTASTASAFSRFQPRDFDPFAQRREAGNTSSPCPTPRSAATVSRSARVARFRRLRPPVSRLLLRPQKSNS
jgi:hypothetical protein